MIFACKINPEKYCQNTGIHDWKHDGFCYRDVFTESTAEGTLAVKPLGQQLNVSTAELQLGLQHLALFFKKGKNTLLLPHQCCSLTAGSQHRDVLLQLKARSHPASIAHHMPSVTQC